MRLATGDIEVVLIDGRPQVRRADDHVAITLPLLLQADLRDCDVRFTLPDGTQYRLHDYSPVEDTFLATKIGAR